MGNKFSQIFPPAAKFTERSLPDQSNKVFIVTGSSTGVGKELAQILYSHNAKVYIAARSQDRASQAIESIKALYPNSKGSLIYLHLDLDDLSTIKASADAFLAKEKRLDVLWNNAGVMVPPQGSKTVQGYEKQLGTNCVGPFLFTKLLLPLLKASARLNPPETTRVVWVSSSAAEISPKGGVDMGNLDYKVDKGAWHKYSVSKAGNLLHAQEFATRYGSDGIISVALNPGNLSSDLQRNLPGWQNAILQKFLYAPINGAYTELFAGVSPDVNMDHNGGWIIPFGRFGPLRADLEKSGKSKKDGGSGIAENFWEWTEEQIKPYL
ncbi:uncharacterized protein L3040_001963 [Drepanopeziza brunnea f. sp. 'multigermtubi']|uniref:Short chain dehydrogenase reductase n=1 Tax=Marssonina brunnea f. sp. multigermtubi (strain MB_m1) TaxID=1072389 RepID=K1WQ23_MARBU|nr:short chain dehydrogenase reductase [Drepanopeziza brunnea f. sp. 'multigermtubi' MB_m1]EKD19690.1 short chain dehydrogenase reductase [Drepanopeziza brunnea f. sp. 'multigermtubi' MB_m1]KAJ5052204.1 hypothetical protein L3040_001963 [Drepanopeziza brunnea f. sp. 'multigermtubi']